MDTVVYREAFEDRDFTDSPPRIYVNCTFVRCAGLVVATDARPYPAASEFYGCTLVGGALPGHDFGMLCVERNPLVGTIRAKDLAIVAEAVATFDIPEEE